MDIKCLAKYQLDTYNQILKYIDEGKKRISVLMSTGAGKNVISYCMLPELLTKGKVLYILDKKNNSLQINDVISKKGYAGVDIALLRDLSGELIQQYTYLILMDLNSSSRKIVCEMCKDYSGFTISYGAPYQELLSVSMNDGLIAYENKKLMGAAFVYTTLRIVDIRDAIEADCEEKKYIENEIKHQKNILESEKQDALLKIEINTANNEEMIERIAAYAKKYQEMHEKQQNKSDEQDISGKMNETNEMIQKLLADKERNEKEIKRLQEANKKKDEMISLQAQLLNGIGISNHEIQEMYEIIEQTRDDMQLELSSDDEEVKERAYSRLQGVVTDLVYERTKKYVVASAERCEEILAKKLSEKVWKERLCEKSRAFLITAKINFDSMASDIGILDYSGVCLLVTKALEVEMTRRFYTKYIEYLKNETDDVSLWPKSIRERQGKNVLSIPIAEYDFTLGSAVPVMGIRRVYDNAGKIIGYEVRSQNDYNKFIEFARNELFENLGFNRVRSKLEQDYLFIEKVRLDYRNPAAHKNRLTRTSAEDCIKYVVEVQKMLKIMLIDMKI